ncbi:MAG: N-acetylmuramoyl-L-alanine amidase [Hyphomicrobium sp.]|nr:N-acetylmuramoyl-L-alanine amidase [Hyphomicrobium sp.]
MITRPDSGLVAALHPSPNIEPRIGGKTPSALILHYTGLPTVERALDVLSRPDCKVSCHYVIDTDGRIIQMVAEDKRAWHAGVSFWAGETDLNSVSIGIEIQNPGHAHGYPDFPREQMAAVTALSRDIMDRHGIEPKRALAHSDVAPSRKVDPGEKFDWEGLAGHRVGVWVPPEPVAQSDAGLGLGEETADVHEARLLLRHYGYGLAQDGAIDTEMGFVLRAFQLHFRPERVDSRLDRSTLVTLQRLVANVSPLVA